MEEQRLRAINKVEAEGAPTSRTLFRNARTAWAAPVSTEPLDSEEQRLLLNNEERLRESLVLYANRALTEERHSAQLATTVTDAADREYVTALRAIQATRDVAHATLKTALEAAERAEQEARRRAERKAVESTAQLLEAVKKSGARAAADYKISARALEAELYEQLESHKQQAESW